MLTKFLNLVTPLSAIGMAVYALSILRPEHPYGTPLFFVGVVILMLGVLWTVVAVEAMFKQEKVAQKE